MHLRSVAALLAAGLASVHAAAIPASNSSLVLLYSRIIGNGRLEYWGVPAAEGEATDFDWESGWGPDGHSGPAPAVMPAAGGGNTASTHNQVQRRCGGNHVHCHEENIAPAEGCEGLIRTLEANPHKVVDPRARGMYWFQGGGKCGVSWHHVPIEGLRNGHLVNAGYKTLRECTRGIAVSGWATDVNLNGVCTVQCLSAASRCFREE